MPHFSAPHHRGFWAAATAAAAAADGMEPQQQQHDSAGPSPEPAPGDPKDAADDSWHPTWGDRCQQIVWIGINMDTAALRRMLDGCLLTDAEMEGGPQAWQSLEDPLPVWVFEGEEGEEEAGQGSGVV